VDVPEVDPQSPSGARIYDYYLGGPHHFAADRQAAAVVLTAIPELPAVLRMGRDFLRRAVGVVAAEGVDQYLDLGAGIPSPGGVTDVARRQQPEARVVSVDVDPVAVVHNRRVAEGDPDAGVLLADLTDADVVLDSEPVRRLIDFSRPVCLLVVAVAHFIPDTDRLGRALERYREVAAPGSYLVMSHASHEGDPRQAEHILRVYNQTTSPMMLREREEFRALFGDWTLVPPGIASAGEWRLERSDLDGPPGRATIAGVAIKP
jgi:S-adenosyl methyltransferase